MDMNIREGKKLFMVRTAVAQDRKKNMDSLNSLLFIVSTIP